MANSTTRIFLTGATGYIGGDLLFAIIERHPHLEKNISVLIRSPEKAAAVAAAYPQLRIVLGDLSDAELLQSEAAACDICLHCASLDDLGSTEAIVRGLTERKRSGPAFWLAVSGTDNLGWKTIETNSYGDQHPEAYDDEDGLGAVLGLPDEAPHRDVEKAQLASASDSIRLAIVSPPCIYGQGRGPGNQRSIQLPDLVKFTLENGASFKINSGQSRWPNVHVQDLSGVFLALFEEAMKGGGRAIWGREGYYFAENGIHVWGDIAQAVAEAAHRKGYIDSPAVLTMTPEAADKAVDFAALFYGTDSVCRALRARRLLGWTPTMHSIETEIGMTLEREAEKLGLKGKS